MGRSKNLHYVQREVDITQPVDPADNWASGVIQVDENLSKKFGTTIRNGNKFRLVGYGLALRSKSSNPEIDAGFACVAGIEYCPVTKHSVNAHQSMYKEWRKQQKLAGIYGSHVRYDDFEVGFDDSNFLPAARNSYIHASGLFDTGPQPANTELISIFGTSVNNSHVTLESYWNNRQPIPAASATEFGTVIKNPKYEDEFPDKVRLYASATMSSVVNLGTVPDTLSGAIIDESMIWLPSDNHVQHLTGTLYYFIKGIPGDTPWQLPDELTAVITLVYEGWSPLNTAKAMGNGKKKSRKSSGWKPRKQYKRRRRRG